jgi:hypothetical protein
VKFEYFVTVFDDNSSEATWKREVFLTLSGTMKYVTKCVRDGWEVRVFKSRLEVKTELTPKRKARNMISKGKSK